MKPVGSFFIIFISSKIFCNIQLTAIENFAKLMEML